MIIAEMTVFVAILIGAIVTSEITTEDIMEEFVVTTISILAYIYFIVVCKQWSEAKKPYDNLDEVQM